MHIGQLRYTCRVYKLNSIWSSSQSCPGRKCHYVKRLTFAGVIQINHRPLKVRHPTKNFVFCFQLSPLLCASSNFLTTFTSIYLYSERWKFFFVYHLFCLSSGLSNFSALDIVIIQSHKQKFIDFYPATFICVS
jgi:hypothetical protein